MLIGGASISSCNCTNSCSNAQNGCNQANRDGYICNLLCVCTCNFSHSCRLLHHLYACNVTFLHMRNRHRLFPPQHVFAYNFANADTELSNTNTTQGRCKEMEYGWLTSALILAIVCDAEPAVLHFSVIVSSAETFNSSGSVPSIDLAIKTLHEQSVLPEGYSLAYSIQDSEVGILI